MHRHARMLGVAGMMLAAAVLGAALAYDSQADAVPNPFPSRERVITVTGYALATAEPDLLAVTLGVETEEATASAALAANSDAMTSIVQNIRSLGISDDDLGTTGLSIYPVYDGYTNPVTGRYVQDLVGYRVNNMVTVTTGQLGLAADIIDGAVAAGANRVDGVSFLLSDQRKIEIRDGLLENAVLDATKKAEIALAPLNHQIIGVKAISLSEPGMLPPVPMYATADMLESGRVSTPIFASDSEVTATANVTFLIGGN